MPNIPEHRRPAGILRSFLGIETELRHYLLKILVRKEDVEDILQDTFMRASRAEDSTHIRSHRPFLFKVAKNLALNQISQNRRRILFYVEDFEASEVIDSKSSVEDREIARQELNEFYTMLRNTLPKQCRRVFILRKVYGFSHKEIGSKLGISVSTVEKHIINAMRKCDGFMVRGGVEAPQSKQPSPGAGNLATLME